MKVLKEYPIPVPARYEKKRKKEIPTRGPLKYVQ
jgi:hypothetical protein